MAALDQDWYLDIVFSNYTNNTSYFIKPVYNIRGRTPLPHHPRGIEQSQNHIIDPCKFFIGFYRMKNSGIFLTEKIKGV